ncbi:hypothetical protein KP509_22G066700 [Ceratopteris richardii]|uniref:Uncharacterized protein n=1 Tax=Ceratopteris richardii TaxID=49495 RepID=A0A8T2S7Y3_CERRI|nr:hypothetical protein KP509_22G066700 [Ceratopteris richardii]
MENGDRDIRVSSEDAVSTGKRRSTPLAALAPCAPAFIERTTSLHPPSLTVSKTLRERTPYLVLRSSGALALINTAMAAAVGTAPAIFAFALASATTSLMELLFMLFSLHELRNLPCYPLV